MVVEVRGVGPPIRSFRVPVCPCRGLLVLAAVPDIPDPDQAPVVVIGERAEACGQSPHPDSPE